MTLRSWSVLCIGCGLAVVALSGLVSGMGQQSEDKGADCRTCDARHQRLADPLTASALVGTVAPVPPGPATVISE